MRVGAGGVGERGGTSGTWALLHSAKALTYLPPPFPSNVWGIVLLPGQFQSCVAGQVPFVPRVVPRNEPRQDEAAYEMAIHTSLKRVCSLTPLPAPLPPCCLPHPPTELHPSCTPVTGLTWPGFAFRPNACERSSSRGLPSSC